MDGSPHLLRGLQTPNTVFFLIMMEMAISTSVSFYIVCLAVFRLKKIT